MPKPWISAFALLAACSFSTDIRPPTGGGEGGGSQAGGGAGGSGGGVSPADAGLPLKSACSTLNAARCEYYARCGLLEDSVEARRDCKAWLSSTWCGPTRWLAHVELGVLTYDPLAGQACADALAVRGCEEFETLPSSCNRLTAPNAPLYHACYDGYLECSEGVCRGAACPRSCSPLGIAGDVCQVNSDCRSPLYCRRTGASAAGTCAALGTANAFCNSDEPCTTGLACIGGRCVVPPSAGTACLAGVCNDASWCKFNPDGGVCTAKLANAAPCTADVQCLQGYLCEYGQCAPKVLTLRNTGCGDRQTCPVGLTCVGATSTAPGECLAPLLFGAACIASDDCRLPLACVPSDGGSDFACAQRQLNKESCKADRDCQLFSLCKAGLCTRLPTLGESCTYERSCLGGPCVALNDGGAVCTEKLGAGLRCLRDDDCASGRCLVGTCLPACAP